ncbi:hypothetical protein D3C73_1244530 [compost metagenome]
MIQRHIGQLQLIVAFEQTEPSHTEEHLIECSCHLINGIRLVLQRLLSLIEPALFGMNVEVKT